MTTPFRLDRSLIRISGPDARGFLNNLLTQDVATLGAGQVRYAALLGPQGKVVADMAVWADSGDIFLETDPLRGPDLMRRLALYKLRAHVELEDVGASRQILFSPTAFGGALPDPRFPDGALGWRALATRAPDPRPDGAAAYEALRLARGAPDLARDAAPEEVFALEALLEELNGVDFGKGCFVGQENVSRMKRRATTRKKFCPIAFEGEALPFGTPVFAGAAEIGTVRSGARGRAIALVRLDRAREAIEAGAALTAADRTLRLDPPAWLAMPREA